MGEAAPRMLETLDINYRYVHSAKDFPGFATLLKKTYKQSLISAAFLSRGLWDETK